MKSDAEQSVKPEQVIEVLRAIQYPHQREAFMEPIHAVFCRFCWTGANGKRCYCMWDD